MEQLVIYKLGETHLQTTITNGFADYTDGKRPEAYLDELGPGYAILPFDHALDLMEKAEEIKYIKPWEEITEETWDYFLEVLPPEHWRTKDGVDIFRMSEYTQGNITQHYAKYNGRYFAAFRRTTNDYKALAEEVQEIFQKNSSVSEMVAELPLERQQEYYA